MKALYESILDDEEDLLDGQDITIHNWLKENSVINGSYTVNNGVVDVQGNIMLNEDIHKIGVKFGTINGRFNISNCYRLTSLENCPHTCNRFDCSGCDNIKTLEGGPTNVIKQSGITCAYLCYGCKHLKNLKGAPEKIDGEFSCMACMNLTSLKGGPKEAVDFYCHKCSKLKTLKGCPKVITGQFRCDHCGFTIADDKPDVFPHENEWYFKNNCSKK